MVNPLGARNPGHRTKWSAGLQGEPTKPIELPSQLVVRRRLLQWTVALDVVLDPELRTSVLDERFDCGAIWPYGLC
jgi:hypothetical protein